MSHEHDKYRMLVDNLPDGFAYHRIITDSAGNPVDYMFLGVNDAFCQMTGLERESILGKKVTKILPGIEKSAFDWIGTYGKVALGGGPIHFNSYSEQLDRWYEVTAYSDAEGCFAVLLHETTEVEKTKEQLMKTAHLAEEFLAISSGELDYQRISDHLLDLAGAKYVVFNLYDDDGKNFTTVALAGIREKLRQASSLLGIPLVGKKWSHDPVREEKIRGNLITRFSGLLQLSGAVLPPRLVKLVERIFQIGEILVVQILREGRMIGDFTIIMEDGKEFKNDTIVEIFTRQVGLVLTRKKAEEMHSFLSSITENMSDSLVVTDTSFVITYMNKGAEALYGYSLDEVVGQSPGIFNGESLAKQRQQEIYETVSSGRTYTGESLNIRKDGTTFVCGYKVVPLYDKKGAIYAYVGIQRDITKQKEQEEQLKRRDEQLNYFFSQSLHGFFFMMLEEPITWDETTDKEKALDYIFEHQHMTRVNKALLDQYGAKEEEFIGLTPSDLFAHDIEHGRHIWKGLFDEGRWHVETREQRLDGTPIIIDGDYICLYDEEGRITGHFGVQVDVTAQKKIQQKLKENEERLNTLISQTPAVIYSYILIGGLPAITYVNENVTHVLGFEPEEIINNPDFFNEHLHPDDVQKIADSMPKLMGEGRVTLEEYRFKDKGGHYHWLHDEQRLFTHGDGTLEVIGSWWDITDRKQAEADLLESEQRFDLAIAGTGAGLWDWDMVNETVYFSKRWKEMLGYQEEEVENSFSGWKNLWHPADAEKIEQAVQDHLQGRTEKYEVEHRLRDRRGRWRWILTRGDLIRDKGGNPVRWVGTNIDLTHIKEIEEELLRSQQRLASVVQTQHEMISRFLPDTTLTFVNEAYCRYYNMPYQELVGKKYLDFIPQEEHPAVIEKLSKLNKDNPFQTYLQPILQKDGSKGWQEWTDQAILDGSDKLVEIQSIGRDITAQKRVEEELKRSNTDLEQFAYAVSHDMRQPLRMISSYLQLLEKDLEEQLDEDTREYLHFALDGAKRMDQMILALLEYSRVGRKTSPKEQINIKEALQEALLFLDPTIKETEAQIHIQGDWPWLFASFDMISRLFQNLISNGLKYQKKGHQPKLLLEVENQDPEWLFSLKDNGIGIDPSQVERLFKVFSRLHARGAYEGTGVGLALCRKIVEHHNGRIWVESEGLGEGSTFYFTLPII